MKNNVYEIFEVSSFGNKHIAYVSGRKKTVAYIRACIDAPIRYALGNDTKKEKWDAKTQKNAPLNDTALTAMLKENNTVEFFERNCGGYYINGYMVRKIDII